MNIYLEIYIYLIYLYERGMNILTMDGRFEWDSRKNKENMRKHNIRFAEILSVFDDPFPK